MQDEDDPSITHFKPLLEIETIDNVIDDRSWLQKIRDWWNNSSTRPYVKMKDLNNGDDADNMNTPVVGIEAGIKIDF